MCIFIIIPSIYSWDDNILYENRASVETGYQYEDFLSAKLTREIGSVNTCNVSNVVSGNMLNSM